MKYLYYPLILALPVCAHAQDFVLSKNNNKINGAVRNMQLKNDMLFMMGDSIVRGEHKLNHVYFFNDQQQITSHIAIVDYSHDTLHFTYNYNAQGQLISKVAGHNGAMHRFNNAYYTYANGKLAQVSNRIKGEEGGMTASRYTYYDDSFSISTITDAGAELDNASTCIYDNKHVNIVKVRNYNALQTRWTEVYEYNEYNDPVKQTTYLDNGKMANAITYEYTYDDHHNFTQRFEFKNGRPYSLTERQITYY